MLKVGDTVALLRDTVPWYSGYGANPSVTLPAGTAGTVQAVNVPIADALYSAAVAGVSCGKVVLDLELYHPVFLDEAGKAIVEHAQSRMDRVQPATTRRASDAQVPRY